MVPILITNRDHTHEEISSQLSSHLRTAVLVYTPYANVEGSRERLGLLRTVRPNENIAHITRRP
jgi:hypothetical protein